MYCAYLSVLVFFVEKLMSMDEIQALASSSLKDVDDDELDDEDVDDEDLMV